MTKIPFCSSSAKAFLCENEHILKKNSTKNFSPAFHDLESGFTQTLLTEINFQKYVDLNCAKLWSLASEAPLKGELAVRSTDWGVSTYAENTIKRFYEKTSPPPNGGPPLLSGEAIKQCPHSPKWKTSPTALWKSTTQQSGTVFNIVENHFGWRRRCFPQKIHQRGKLVENVFSQKIPVSGGLPVLIPKNRRFLSKTHCVSCGIL